MLTTTKLLPLIVVPFLILHSELILACQESQPNEEISNSETESDKGSEALLQTTGMIEMLGVGQEGTGGGIVSLEVGDLEPDRLYIIEAGILNRTIHPISFDSAEKNCNCAKFEPTQGEIPVAGIAQFEIKLKTPKSTVDGKFSTYAQLMDGKDLAFQISVHTNLIKNLHVDSSHSFVVRGDQPAKFEVPFSFTRPIDSKNLRLISSEQFGDAVELVLQAAKGRGVVQVQVDSSKFLPTHISGAVEIVDDLTGVTAKTELLLLKKTKFSISPTVVQFSRPDAGGAKELKDNRFVGAAILDLGPNPHSASMPKVTCAVDDFVFSVETKKMSSRLFRVSLKIDSESVVDGSLETRLLNWTVRHGDDSSIFQTPIFFER